MYNKFEYVEQKYLPLFPTMVMVHELKEVEENKKEVYVALEHLFQKVKENPDERDYGGIQGQASCTNFHHYENLQPLYTQISARLFEYVETLYGGQFFDISITESWINCLTPDEHIPLHDHCDAHLSFVYYPSIPSEYESLLHFQKAKQPNDINNALVISHKSVLTQDKLNDFNTTIHSFACKEGLLFVFPSSMQHGSCAADDSVFEFESVVPKDRTMEYLKSNTRMSISGDVILTYNEQQLVSRGLQPLSSWMTFASK